MSLLRRVHWIIFESITSISGLDWVKNRADTTGRSSVVNMSLGGLISPSLDEAVGKLTDVGIHVAVAAGNNGLDADLYSPARAPTAVTVGASTIQDQRAYFSNYGIPVKIFAPGQDITSAWNKSDDVSFLCFVRPFGLPVLRLLTLSLEPRWRRLTLLD